MNVTRIDQIRQLAGYVILIIEQPHENVQISEFLTMQEAGYLGYPIAIQLAVAVEVPAREELRSGACRHAILIEIFFLVIGGPIQEQPRRMLCRQEPVSPATEVGHIYVPVAMNIGEVGVTIRRNSLVAIRSAIVDIEQHMEHVRVAAKPIDVHNRGPGVNARRSLG